MSRASSGIGTVWTSCAELHRGQMDPVEGVGGPETAFGALIRSSLRHRRSAYARHERVGRSRQEDTRAMSSGVPIRPIRLWVRRPCRRHQMIALAHFFGGSEVPSGTKVGSAGDAAAEGAVRGSSLVRPRTACCCSHRRRGQGRGPGSRPWGCVDDDPAASAAEVPRSRAAPQVPSILTAWTCRHCSSVASARRAGNTPRC